LKIALLTRKKGAKCIFSVDQFTLQTYSADRVLFLKPLRNGALSEE